MAGSLSDNAVARRGGGSNHSRRFRDWPTAVRRSALLAALVVAAVLYAWPRTLDLDRVVTVDEPVFLGMSANFVNALAHGQYAKTDQFLYPAVPVMWAGAAGFLATLPNYVQDHPAQIEPTDDFVLTTVDGPIRDAGGDPLTLLIAARTAKIALQTV